MSWPDKVELKTLDGVVDVVGTGGDGANIFNVSTAVVLRGRGGRLHRGQAR